MTSDYFTREIVKHHLVAASDEMMGALRRCSMSPIIYETLDFAVGVTDASGNLITQGNGVTGFLGTLDAAVGSVVAKHQRIEPGDVFITNDPYTGGGTHLSDVSLVMPVFFDGRIVAYVVNKAHWTEVGGKDPGSWTTDATEVYQEGLRFPCLRLFGRGQPSAALLELIASNVRFPEMTLGDLWAGVAALHVGERRIGALCRRHGAATFKDACTHLLDASEAAVRGELAALPQGSFEAEDYIDDDGVSSGPLRVRVKVTITDSDFICDFSGSHAEAPGPVNGTRSGLVSSVRTVFKAVTGPQLPVNHGSFRPLVVICPDRTVFTAAPPAPVSTYWESLEYATDLVWKALAPHVPERLPAGHLLSVCGTIVSGMNPDTGEPYLLVEPLVGGWGAGCGKDGENGQFCAGDGETYNVPVEVAEARHGLLVEQYALHSENGGAGTFRGGKGVVLDYRVLGRGAEVTASFGRHKYPPWGLAGGQAGSRNYIELWRADGGRAVTGKLARARLAPGDVVRLVTATGGGYGPPENRPQAKVIDDIKNGYVTLEQAVRDYGFEPPVTNGDEGSTKVD